MYHKAKTTEKCKNVCLLNHIRNLFQNKVSYSVPRVTRLCAKHRASTKAEVREKTLYHKSFKKDGVQKYSRTGENLRNTGVWGKVFRKIHVLQFDFGGVLYIDSK